MNTDAARIVPAGGFYAVGHFGPLGVQMGFVVIFVNQLGSIGDSGNKVIQFFVYRQNADIAFRRGGGFPFCIRCV